jgi:phage gp45-like
VGGDDAVDSDADPTTGLTGPINLTAGETNLTVDAGVYCPAKLGDRIWLDNNQDGDQNCSEVNLANPGQVIPGNGASCDEPTFTDKSVKVDLTDCNGNTAKDINGANVLAVTTSASPDLS